MKKLISAYLLFICSSVNAGIITIDADGYNDGDILNNEFLGATLSAFGASSTTGNVYARTYSSTSTGGMVFGNDSNPSPWWFEGLAELRVDLQYLTDYISVDVGADNDASDYGEILAYDQSDNLLENIQSGLLSGTDYETLSINRSINDISYFVVRGINPDDVLIDNIKYNYIASVPEPSSLFILLLFMLSFVCGCIK